MLELGIPCIPTLVFFQYLSALRPPVIEEDDGDSQKSANKDKPNVDLKEWRQVQCCCFTPCEFKEGDILVGVRIRILKCIGLGGGE